MREKRTRTDCHTGVAGCAEDECRNCRLPCWRVRWYWQRAPESRVPYYRCRLQGERAQNRPLPCFRWNTLRLAVNQPLAPSTAGRSWGRTPAKQSRTRRRLLGLQVPKGEKEDPGITSASDSDLFAGWEIGYCTVSVRSLPSPPS